MKTAEKSLSNASFTAQLFRLSIQKLRRIIAVKWMGFSAFVLICILLRYFAVQADENPELQTRQINLKNTYKKIEIWPAEVMLNSYVEAKKVKLDWKNRRKNFRKQFVGTPKKN